MLLGRIDSFLLILILFKQILSFFNFVINNNTQVHYKIHIDDKDKQFKHDVQTKILGNSPCIQPPNYLIYQLFDKLKITILTY